MAVITDNDGAIIEQNPLTMQSSNGTTESTPNPRNGEQTTDSSNLMEIKASLGDDTGGVTAEVAPNGKPVISLPVNARTEWDHKGSQDGSVLTFKDLTYTVPNKGRPGCPCVRRSEVLPKHKVILDSASGMFRPGLNAIMGPTGSGKTTLLDVLAARKPEQFAAGTVLLNGSPRPRNVKSKTGYVIQDDTLMGMLTVRENITFSAALRLPQSLSQQERQTRVEEVIVDLGLEQCANTKVGTELRRGISGGEMKRTSIAMELLTCPAVLFLDEPTTGLDAAMAQSVMWALKRLSSQGTTIVLSVHQPRFSIYRMIDTLHLLLQGHSVYHGPATQAVQFFSSIGYTCESGDNPADFILDVLSGYVAADDAVEHAAIRPNSGKIKSTEEGIVLLELENTDSDERSKRQNHLVEAYRTSDWYSRTQAEIKPYPVSDHEVAALRDVSVHYPTSFVRQLNVVCRRTFFNMIRNPHTLITQVFSAVILALIIGTIYFQVDTSYSSGIQNRVGAFFFIVMNHVFGNMAAVDLFIKDRALFIHENISGFYRVSVYFIAKLTCDVLPTRALPILAFSAISYWMIGLRGDIISFLVYILTVLLTSLSATSVALTMSATVETHTIGTVFTALVWVLMMVFSGLLVNIMSLAPWLRWLRYVSVFSYSMNALTVNELKGAQMCEDRLVSNTTINICESGEDYMTRQGISHSSTWDLWLNHVALVGLATGFLLLTYVQLRRMNKLR